jgi:membrane fusion protein (multidrug efflux system)
VRAEVQRAEQLRHSERLANHRREHQRKIQLAAQGLLAEESLTSSQSELTQQQAALRVAEQQLIEIERRLGSAPLRQHPQLQLASAELRRAAYRLNKHSVRTPTAGYVTKRYINLGQLVEAGTPLLSHVDPSERWLEANFKEDQLRHMRLGQPVTIESELYGSERTFKGVVAAAGFATGAEFALLPPQNATGNWVKILQRVPVRIEFTEGLASDTPLPIGASLTVTVDTHQRHGSAPIFPTGERQPRRAAIQQRDYSGDVEAVIAATIAAHLAP